MLTTRESWDPRGRRGGAWSGRPHRLCCLLALPALLGPCAASAQDTYPFFGRRGYDIYGNTARGIVFGEFNGDGSTDLAVCVDVGPTDGLRILLNATHGALELTDALISTGSNPVWVATMRVGNGETDDLIVHNLADETVVVLVNDGAGAFEPMQPTPLPAGTVVVTLADLDGDHQPDLLAAGPTGLHQMRWLGGGLFAPPVAMAPLSASPSRMVTMQLDGDGRADVAVLSETGSLLDVFLGDGAGGVRAATVYEMPAGARSLAAGDIDADGRTDLAIGRTHEADDDWCGVLALLGDGGGGLSASEIITPTQFGALRLQPFEIRLAPLDGDDARDDLLLLGGQGNGVVIMPGIEDDEAFFGAPTIWSDLYYNYDAAFGDINADGLPDMAVTGRASYGKDLHVFLNDGSGRFHAPAELIPLPGASFARSADVDGGGSPDLCVLSEEPGGGASTLWTLLNGGDGRLGAPSGRALDVHAGAVALVDVRGVGAPDAIAAGGAGIAILPNLGTGGGEWLGFGDEQVLTRDYDDDAIRMEAVDFKFNKAEPNTPDADLLTLGRGFSYVSRVHLQRNLGAGAFAQGPDVGLIEETNDWALADIDLDGDVDLVTVAAGEQESQLQTWFNQVDPDLFTGQTKTLRENDVTALVAADVTGDGYPDLIAVDDGFRVYINRGNGQFADGSFYAVPLTRLAAVGDLNADGSDDIVLVTGVGDGRDMLYVSFGRGDGEFGECYATPLWGLEGGGPPTDLLATDLDGDGRAEVAVVLGALPGEERIAIFRVRAADGVPCGADFNGDGVVDTRDVVAFLNAWAAGDASADIDGNGVVDTRDVIAFLNVWAAGC